MKFEKDKPRPCLPDTRTQRLHTSRSAFCTTLMTKKTSRSIWWLPRSRISSCGCPHCSTSLTKKRKSIPVLRHIKSKLCSRNRNKPPTDCTGCWQVQSALKRRESRRKGSEKVGSRRKRRRSRNRCAFVWVF